MPEIEIQKSLNSPAGLPEIEKAVGDGFQLVQHVAAVNAVAAVRLSRWNAARLRAGSRNRSLCATIKYILLEVIAEPGNNTQKAPVALEQRLYLKPCRYERPFCRYNSSGKDLSTASTNVCFPACRASPYTGLINASPICPQNTSALFFRLPPPGKRIPTKKKFSYKVLSCEVNGMGRKALKAAVSHR